MYRRQPTTHDLSTPLCVACNCRPCPRVASAVERCRPTSVAEGMHCLVSVHVDTKMCYRRADHRRTGRPNAPDCVGIPAVRLHRSGSLSGRVGGDQPKKQTFTYITFRTYQTNIRLAYTVSRYAMIVRAEAFNGVYGGHQKEERNEKKWFMKKSF